MNSKGSIITAGLQTVLKKMEEARVGKEEEGLGRKGKEEKMRR